MDIILAILGSSVISTLIAQIGNYIMHRRTRKDNKADDFAAIQKALRMLLADRIQERACAAIKQGEIELTERDWLNDAHGCYHNGLHGNGNFDRLKVDWNNLPLVIPDKAVS